MVHNYQHFQLQKLGKYCQMGQLFTSNVFGK